MDPRIDDYIRDNEAKYTREAIRDQLIAAGHDPAAIDAALQRADAAAHAAPTGAGWRLGWRSSLLLVGLGAVGAGLIWQNQMYSAGGIAAVIYAVIAAFALLVGRGISIMIDRGSSGAAAALLGLIGAAGALVLINSNALLLGAAAALLAAGLVSGLLVLRRTNPARASLLGAAVPIVFWLVVTGTCYAPIFGPAVVQPTTTAGTIELRIEPPLSFTGSGVANCTIYTSGFSVNGENLGTIGNMTVTVSAASAGDPNSPPSSGNGDRAVTLTIGLNSPSGGGYVTYGSPRDATFTMRAAADGISGTAAFDGLVRQTAEGPESSGANPGPIAGTISWTCG